jgi:hypothetical protein
MPRVRIDICREDEWYPLRDWQTTSKIWEDDEFEDRDDNAKEEQPDE